MAKQSIIIAACVLTSLLPAQTTDVYLPDAMANTGVVGNVIPFSPTFGTSPGAFTHLMIIPAAALAAGGVQPGDRLVDVRLAPTGSGTVVIPSFLALVGHLQSPLATMGFLDSFLDAQTAWDSGASGPLTWHCTGNTWCSLGIGGGGFLWDGIHDVGFYTTHSGLTLTSNAGWTGACWRSGTLYRKWASGLGVATASSLVQNGLKIGLIFANPNTPVAGVTWYGQGTAGANGIPQLIIPDVPSFGNSSFVVGMDNAWPGAAAVLMVSSLAADVQIGVGANVHLLVDLRSSAAVFYALRTVDGFGGAAVPVPVPAYDPALFGLPVQCQWAVYGDPGAPLTVYGLHFAFTSAVSLLIGV